MRPAVPRRAAGRRYSPGRARRWTQRRRGRDRFLRPRPADARRSSGGALKLVLLAALLVVHFLSRQHLIPTRPQREGWNYPYVYRTSLALMAGRGFSMLRFSDAPESKPVVEFLNGQRDGLSRDEFRRFRDGPDARPVAFPLPEAQAPLPHYPPGGELATPLSPLHTTCASSIFTGQRFSGKCSASAGRSCSRPAPRPARAFVCWSSSRPGGSLGGAAATGPACARPSFTWRRRWRTTSPSAPCGTSVRCGSRPWPSPA